MSDYAKTGEICAAGYGDPHRFTGDTSDGIVRCVFCAKRWADGTATEGASVTITAEAREHLISKVRDLAGYHIDPNGLDYRGAGSIVDLVLGRVGVDVVWPSAPDAGDDVHDDENDDENNEDTAMPIDANEIITALFDDIARESRRGQMPVSMRLGSEVRLILAARPDAPGGTDLRVSPTGTTLLGIPVDEEEAIDPAGIAVSYEPKP